jgi:hypothetical protein
VICCKVLRCDGVRRKGKVVMMSSAKVAATTREAATVTPRRCTDGASDAVYVADGGGTYGRSA